jgi:hypothetical protein
MKRHDETILWKYAARELDAAEAKMLEHHLEECLECREGLLEVRQARALLDDVEAPKPAVNWAKVDAGISQMVEARLVKQAKQSAFSWRFATAMACAASLIAVIGVGLKQRMSEAEMVAPAIALAPSGTHVDSANGLSKVGPELAQAFDGDVLEAGDVLRTSLVGHAVLTLPDDSRMRLSPGTQVALTRAEANDVALTLERGRVAVHASHRQRRGFVVHSSGLSVRVIGTLFTVEQMAGAVEVAVVEGKVRVEPPEGEPMFLVPGERVKFDQNTWKVEKGSVTSSQIADFADLSVPPMVEAQGASRPAPGGLTPPPMPPPAEKNGLLPRLTAKESASRIAKPAAAPPASAKRPPMAQAGTLAVMGAQEEQAPLKSSLKTSDPAEYARWSDPTPPIASAPPPAPEPVKPSFEPVPFPVASEIAEPKMKPQGEELATDLEAIFLQRAERNLGRGICERSLMGLDELAGDASHGERAEKARILRARCFDSKVRPDLSEIEYRRYLMVWPNGRYSVEARQALE